MKVYAFRFTAKKLKSIHSDHLGFVVASSHCCNELTLISPYLIFEHDLEKANEVERSFILIRFFTIVRLQIAKIFEYRDLCNRYVATLRKTYPATAPRIARRTSEISRRIRGAKWAETVRNKVAFHFDPSYALECLRDFPPDAELSLFAGQMRGVTAFDFADRILMRAMFLDAGKGDEAAGRDAVMRWTIDLQKLITAFHAETLADVFRANGLMQRQIETEIRDHYCAQPGSVATPLSTLET